MKENFSTNQTSYLKHNNKQPQTLNHLFYQRINKSRARTAFKRKVKGTWEEISFEQYGLFVNEMSLGLQSLGVIADSRVAILSQTRLEWSLADFSIITARAISIPIYQSNTAVECQYILKDANVLAIFVENQIQLTKILSIRKDLPLKFIITFETCSEENGKDVISFEDLCRLGREYEQTHPDQFEKTLLAAQPTDLVTFVYTSGTTGVPKGVELTHENFMSELQDIEKYFLVTEEDVLLTFLPFAHILGRIEHFSNVAYGWCLSFAEGIPQLTENLPEIRPTVMFCVPRIYEKVYAAILSQVQSGGFVKKAIFNWAVSVGRQVSQLKIQKKTLSIPLQLQYRLAYQLVFQKLQQKFGGRVRFFVSGGAPLARHIGEFFHAAGFLILEGYGLTETAAAITINQEDQYKFGTVGLPLGDVKIKIAADGEILAKSKKIFKKYHNLPKETAETFVDGWFKTGDIGEIDSDGFLKITDRKKEIIVTAGGKNVAPQKIENLLKSEPIISQVMVHGDRRNYLTALVTLNPDEVRKIAANLGIRAEDYAELIQHPRIVHYVEEKIDLKNKELASFETVKKFRILEQDFTIETGELTPSLKVKRKYCTQKYKDILDGMYQECCHAQN